MKSIQAKERRVVNIKDADFKPYSSDESGEQGTSFLQLNPDMRQDLGFYIYKMEPGSSSTPHRHGGAEEFYVIEGELTDNDGTIYRKGDVVWLAPGTEHNSYSENGCIVAVFSEDVEEKPGS
ncbi:MAG: cupin domain-containing protein [Pseudomonadota bacterium]